MKLVVSILFWIFASVSAVASNFPQHVTLVMKQRSSCRDVKRLVKKNRLYVHCAQNDLFAREFAADYFGTDPLPQVLGVVASYSKVLAAVPSTN